MKKISWLKLFISIIVCLGTGFIGSIFTTPSILTWYSRINKPAFNPPNWIFAPVWTILFIMMGVSLYLIWNKGLKKKESKEALIIFILQLAINVLWSILFFGLHSPLYAYFDIVILWLLIILTIFRFKKISLTAAWLLIPYLFWVSFASVLNLSVYFLNR
jgi:translocator protein